MLVVVNVGNNVIYCVKTNGKKDAKIVTKQKLLFGPRVHFQKVEREKRSIQYHKKWCTLLVIGGTIS